MFFKSFIKVRENAWYSSSANPERLSLTIQGLVIMLVPIIIAWGQWNGIEFTETQIIDYVKVLLAWLAALQIVIGGVRKITKIMFDW